MAAAGLRKDEESVTIVLLRFHYSTIFGIILVEEHPLRLSVPLLLAFTF